MTGKNKKKQNIFVKQIFIDKFALTNCADNGPAQYLKSQKLKH